MSRRSRYLDGTMRVASASGLLGGRRSFVKSIQNKTISLGVAATSGTVAITAVDVGNTIISFNGAISNNLAKASDITINDAMIVLTSSILVTGTRGAQNGSDNMTIKFQVIEYYPGFLRSVQRGTMAATVSTTAAINPVDVNKAYVTSLGTQCSSAVDGPPYLELTSSTVVTATAIGGTAWTTGFQVIEFY